VVAVVGIDAGRSHRPVVRSPVPCEHAGPRGPADLLDTMVAESFKVPARVGRSTVDLAEFIYERR
jgi:hypothetical protein